MGRFFEEKNDPVNEQAYRPLLLDPLWWRVRFVRSSSRFISNPAAVLSIIADTTYADQGAYSKREVDIDVPALQELIYQSNRGVAAASSQQYARIGRWPEIPRGRLDDLHYCWEMDDSLSHRRQIFAQHGLSTLSDRGPSCPPL